jgi:hypothetical protein
MNERIRELAEQAGGGPSKWYTDPDVLEKFAKLIVRECIWALWTEECRTSDLASEEYTRSSNKINDHFRS